MHFWQSRAIFGLGDVSFLSGLVASNSATSSVCIGSDSRNMHTHTLVACSDSDSRNMHMHTLSGREIVSTSLRPLCLTQSQVLESVLVILSRQELQLGLRPLDM